MSLNSQSTIRDAARRNGLPRDEAEDARRVQLIEVTIDSLAEVGFVGTTLAEIAGRAGVSPGLVAHYFGDKDGLLEAAFRTLARVVAVRMRERFALAPSPRARVQAVIDANLGPENFDRRTGNAWLAFWGQVLHFEGLKRVQTAYQRRMLSNLRSDLRRMIPGEAARSLAAMIAAMIGLNAAPRAGLGTVDPRHQSCDRCAAGRAGRGRPGAGECRRRTGAAGAERLAGHDRRGTRPVAAARSAAAARA